MSALSTTRRRHVVLVAVAAPLLVLTACTPMKSGSAAIVGDQSLTEAQVGDTADEVNSVVATADAELSLSPADLNQRIVSMWVDEELTEELASDEGVTASDADVDQFLSQYDQAQRLQIVTQAGIPPSQLPRAAKTVVLRNKLADELTPDGSQQEKTAALAAALVKTAEDLGVSVNPRFGKWNGTIPGVEPRATDRLSTLAGAPSTSPTPSPGP